jgi:predicted nucleotidyltransferase component of viral defense system
MANKSFDLREFFHLTFLRHLSHRLSGRAYAVKGGICMRFFHGSPRLSEDMDLDIIDHMPVRTLQNAVDTVLASQPLLTNLIAGGITGISSTKPKQTETTQRWKVQLQFQGDKLQTKIEFSRRKTVIQYGKGVPNPELLSQYKAPQFAAQFYSSAQMVSQKTIALAASTRNAVRDLFDLHHLLLAVGVDIKTVTQEIKKETIEAAIEKIESFSFKDFNEQVRPYLTAELVAAYEESPAFDRMKEETSDKLFGLLA